MLLRDPHSDCYTQKYVIIISKQVPYLGSMKIGPILLLLCYSFVFVIIIWTPKLLTYLPVEAGEFGEGRRHDFFLYTEHLLITINNVLNK